MKKALLLILALVMCVTFFASCAEGTVENSSGVSETESNDSETSKDEMSTGESSLEEVVFDETPRDIEFVEHSLSVGFKYGSSENEGFAKTHIIGRGDSRFDTFVLDSEDKIEPFLSALEYPERAEDFFESLPEDFFERKLLLINDFLTPMTGYRGRVRRVRADEDGVTLEFVYTHGEMGSDVVIPCVFLTEIDKADVAGCESFGAESKKVDFDTTERELEYISHSFVGELKLNYVDIPADSVVVTAVYSKGSLQRLVEGSDSEEFAEFAKDKDSKYFQKNSLIIAYVISSSSGNEFRLDGVSCSEYGTAVRINRALNDTDDKEVKHILVVEVDADEVFGVHEIYPAVSDTEEWQRKQSAPIYINGKLAENVECELDIIAREVELPLVATLDSLGASIEWTSSEKASVSFNGRSYTLSLKTKKLVRGNEDRLWGEVENRTSEEQELYVDYIALWGFLLRESDFDLYVNYNGNYIELVERNY